jgi:CHASE2 domain-containing sensor protein
MAMCAWAVVDVMFVHVTSGLAAPTYDAMVRARFHAAAPDPRIVIVDIDEASLLRMGKEFGSWPWPRDTLATVLDYVEKQAPAAVLWDVVFSEPDLLNPGGDAAFNTAVANSAHSHFSVVRLPPGNDAQSQISQKVLPGLWLPGQLHKAGQSDATVALIPPALPDLAAGRLGYNNGYVDPDGVLRQYRYAERLSDGSAIQSIALSALSGIVPDRYQAMAAQARVQVSPGDELIAWRAKADSYPRVPFADVFDAADGGRQGIKLPDFKGKVILIGSTAPNLHDVHPTSLSPHHLGVDALATAVDNALNGHQLRKLPLWLQLVLACALFVGLAIWVSTHSVASLAPVTMVVPALLLGLSYLSLNLLPVFVDLHIAAGFGLLMLAALRAWSDRRRDYWCHLPTELQHGELQLWLLAGHKPWDGAALEALMNALQKHAPHCRLVLTEGGVTWPAKRNFPALAEVVAVVGSGPALGTAQVTLQNELIPYLRATSEMMPSSPDILMSSIFAGWSVLLAPANPDAQSPNNPTKGSP